MLSKHRYTDFTVAGQSKAWRSESIIFFFVFLEWSKCINKPPDCNKPEINNCDLDYTDLVTKCFFHVLNITNIAFQLGFLEGTRRMVINYNCYTGAEYPSDKFLTGEPIYFTTVEQHCKKENETEKSGCSYQLLPV